MNDQDLHAWLRSQRRQRIAAVILAGCAVALAALLLLGSGLILPQPGPAGAGRAAGPGWGEVTR